MDPKVVGGFLASQMKALVAVYRAYWGIRNNRDANIAPVSFKDERFNSKKLVN